MVHPTHHVGFSPETGAPIGGGGKDDIVSQLKDYVNAQTKEVEQLKAENASLREENLRQNHELKRQSATIDQQRIIIASLTQSLQAQQDQVQQPQQPPRRRGHSEEDKAEMFGLLRSRAVHQLMEIPQFGGTGKRATILFNGLKTIDSIDDLTEICQVGPKRKKVIIDWAKEQLGFV